MKGGPNNRNEIIKTENFPQRTIKKLKNSKYINKKDKKSYEEAVC